MTFVFAAAAYYPRLHQGGEYPSAVKRIGWLRRPLKDLPYLKALMRKPFVMNHLKSKDFFYVHGRRKRGSGPFLDSGWNPDSERLQLLADTGNLLYRTTESTAHLNLPERNAHDHGDGCLDFADSGHLRQSQSPEAELGSALPENMLWTKEVTEGNPAVDFPRNSGWRSTEIDARDLSNRDLEHMTDNSTPLNKIIRLLFAKRNRH